MPDTRTSTVPAWQYLSTGISSPNRDLWAKKDQTYWTVPSRRQLETAVMLAGATTVGAGVTWGAR